MNALAASLMLTWCCSCYCFNVDTKFPLLYSGPSGSYFGYTVALHKNSGGPVILAGAPRANSSTLNDVIYQPGALYRCNATKEKTGDACKEIALLKEGNTLTGYPWDDTSYRDKKDGMFLGVSLDVRPTTTQKDTVVCGHLWKNARFSKEYYVNGVCYVIDSELNEDSVRKLLPLVRNSRRFRNFNGFNGYNFAYGQAGMSAVFTENGSNLLLGAPGILSWVGSIVNYPVYPGRNAASYDNPIIPDPPTEVYYNSYFGYSVTSGKFFLSRNGVEMSYAVGAPRDAQTHGMVYIVNGAGYQLSVLRKKKGEQLGEYFGACVLGVDLNADTYTDLLVGAPLFSLESAGDEGKVYVYISNKNDLQKYTEIAGDRKPGARFGTTIASIGDINQDGFNDVAVGAPYEEGQGAIYIYHGAYLGLNSRYEQKIKASSINRNLQGFGIHISRGLDIDDNKYPDIVVGSYASANAVLFRSRPVVNVFPMLNFNPKQIPIQSSCVQDNTNLTCVQVKACLRYNGEHVSSSLVFQLTVQIQDQRQRAFFVQNSNQKAITKRNMIANTNTTDCFAFTMFLYPEIKDVITPIQVGFSHKLISPSNADKFIENLPVYHPTSLKNITSYVPFQTGCGKSDECLSNLDVSVTRLYPPGDVKFLTLGVISNISVEFVVKNYGEPAYLSELHIYLPPKVSSIKQDICESAGAHRNASLICELGNPLKNNSEVRIYIKLDITKIPPHTEYLEILFEVITVSTDTNPEDNSGTLPIFPETIYDIGITGISSPDQIMDDGKNELPAIINHYYIIRNYGPSPLQTIYFSLHIPSELSTSDGLKSILSITDVKADQRSQNVQVSCDETSLNIKSVVALPKQRGKTSDEGQLIPEDFRVLNATASKKTVRSPSDLKRSEKLVKDGKDANPNKDNPDVQTLKMRSIKKIDCERKDIRCVELRCNATFFTNLRQYAEIAVSFQVNFTVLDKYLGSWSHINLSTNGSIEVKDDAHMKQNVYPDTSKVKTDLIHGGPLPPEELQSWIIFVSIGVGVLLLILILILLVKIGFFRRKEKDKMRKMLSEAKKVKKAEDKEAITDEDYCEAAEEDTSASA